MGAYCFEYGNDIAAFGARFDRAAVNKNPGSIQSRHRHDTGWHVLVAAADCNDAIESLGSSHCLDRISNDFPGDQGVAHAGRAHRNAVRHGNRIEYDTLATRLVRALARLFGKLMNVHVARGDHAPGRGNTNLRPGEVFFFESNRSQHCAAWRLLNTIDNDARKTPQLFFFHRFRSQGFFELFIRLLRIIIPDHNRDLIENVAITGCAGQPAPALIVKPLCRDSKALPGPTQISRCASA